MTGVQTCALPILEFLGSGLENVPHQYNFLLAMADDRRVTRGGPATVLERSMLSKKAQLNPCITAKMGPRPWTEEPREAVVVWGI